MTNTEKKINVNDINVERITETDGLMKIIIIWQKI